MACLPVISHRDELFRDPAQDILGEYYRLHRANLTAFEKNYTRSGDVLRAGVPVATSVYQPPIPSIKISVGGSLVKVSTGAAGAPGEAKRGDVEGFSSASRRRLMRFMAALDRTERPVFCTLTYPDEFSGLERAKRDMDVLGKRFRREFPSASFIWKAESATRKTGESAGQVAHHFHLLVYGAGVIRVRKFLAHSWYDIVGSGDVRHLSAGTSAERIHSFGGIMRYVSKYIAKVGAIVGGWRGRVWGIVARANMPYAPIVEIFITEKQAINLIRLGKRMIRSKGKTLSFGITWIVNAERVLDYMESECFP